MGQTSRFQWGQLIDANAYQNRGRQIGTRRRHSCRYHGRFMEHPLSECGDPAETCPNRKVAQSEDSVAGDALGSARPRRTTAKRIRTGAAAGVIMPAIITAHITKVKRKSAALHGVWLVVPVAAVMPSCSIANGI